MIKLMRRPLYIAAMYGTEGFKENITTLWYRGVQGSLVIAEKRAPLGQPPMTKVTTRPIMPRREKSFVLDTGFPAIGPVLDNDLQTIFFLQISAKS